MSKAKIINPEPPWPRTRAEAAAKALHNLLQNAEPDPEKRVRWEDAGLVVKAQTAMMVATVIATYRAAGGRLR
jgi:hypothetical protein